MSSSSPTFLGEDRDVIEAGYQPQLKRKLSPFASFAVSFSLMSVLVGVFSSYSFALQTAGPFSIWTWPVVVGGQLLIALVFAEMAGRIPLTGSIYNWNAKLGSPTLAWQAGWLVIYAYSIAGVAVVVALMTPLQSLLGMTFSFETIRILGLAIILLLLLINTYSILVAGELNRYTVFVEIATLVVLSVALLATGFITKSFHLSLLTTIPKTPVPYLPAFLMSSLLAMWTLIGFESPGDVAEETLNARTVAPKSIINSVLFSGAIGFVFIFALSAVIPNVATVSAAADPVSTIVAFYFGTLATKIFLACVVVAIFSVLLLDITYVSRLTFAIARDNRIVGSKFLSKVSSHGVPVNATIFVTLIQIVGFLLFYGQVAIYATTVVLTCLVYLVTLINYARAGHTLPETGTFSLGKWRNPIIAIAILWLLFEIGVLTIPSPFHLAAYISIGILALGFVLQLLFGRRPVR